jgi:outer membrane protein TolC
VLAVEAAYAELERQVFLELEETLENARVTRMVHTIALDDMRSANVAAHLARGLYEQGRGTLLELRDAEQRFTGAKVNAIAARLDLEIALEQLRRAVGADLAPPIAAR